VLKNKFGASQFNFSDKAWRFNNVEIAGVIKDKFPSVMIGEALTPDLDRAELEKQSLALQIQKAEELKTAVETDFVVNNIKGELRPYQRVGVEFFINAHGKAILGDTMGLGKTFQTLAYIAHNKISKTLVICPAIVKRVWFQETKKFTHLKPYIINSKTDLTLDVINEYDIFIANYDILSKFLNILSTARFDIAVIDEAHYIKSSSARRSKCVKIIGRKIPEILLLSGSLMVNRPVELFNPLNLIDPINWGDYYHFTRRYCNGHQGQWGWDASGASHLEELQQKISRYFLRRTKEDVLLDLPPKTFVDIPVELEQDIKDKYIMAEQSFIEYLRDIKKKNKEEINRSLSAEKLVRLGELRILTTRGKIKAAQELAENIIDSGEKIVIFSVYNEPLNTLKEFFSDKAVLVTGMTKEEDKNLAINNFQTNDKIKVFLGGTKAAGIGVTLTAAPNVLMIDYPWTNADRNQAIDRIHRPGLKANHATIYQLIAENTIDQWMQEILNKKQQLFDQLIEGKNIKDNQNSIVNELLNNLVS
jgi:SWI/SNF-related matrix-associated actin-dependent regulator 1 of chromatin subfamily A